MVMKKQEKITAKAISHDRRMRVFGVEETAGVRTFILEEGNLATLK